MSDMNVDYKALFQEQSLLGADFWLHLIAGVVLFCLTLWVGWLIIGLLLGLDEHRHIHPAVCLEKDARYLHGKKPF